MIEKAKHTLHANIVKTVDGPMLAAGGGHFRSLWVRDFCHSVPGLLASGNQEIVRKQLTKIHSMKSKSGWLPRGLDVVSPKLRVVWNLFVSRSPGFLSYENKTLIAEYLGEHKTPAYDSNLLFVLAAKQFENYTGTSLFTLEQLENLLEVYEFGVNGLLHQPAFSDWQDSARREGPILLTHLLFLRVALELKKTQDTKKISQSIQRTFFRNGFYRERTEGDQIALDSQLFILTNRLPLENLNHENMYAELKKSSLWNKMEIPGVPIVPDYNFKEVSWTQNLIGLKNYHDGFIWGWLAAEAFTCAKMYGDLDEANRIIDVFSRSTEKDDYLSEIYSRATATTIKPAQRRLYQSESPFSWTAAKWLEALLP